MRHLNRLCIGLAILLATGELVSAQQRPNRPRPGNNQPSADRPDRAGADKSLKVGERAPLFRLQTLDGERTVDLKTSFQKRPVVLIFGSYT